MSGIYIHIPYCHSKCAYCDFFSTPRVGDIDDYIAAIHREYQWRRNEMGASPPSTIYVGGGTPSILSPNRLKSLLTPFEISNVDEATIEANPEDITPDYVRAIIDCGISRVSMGVQSMNDSLLKAIGRRHSSATTLRAVEILRAGGIKNLSLDLIFGLPTQSVEDWETTLRQTLNLRPEHLSAYSLMYEPGTRLYAQLRAGKISETPQEVSEQMYATLCRMAAETGMTHYEISNFALPGYHSRHNSSYWNLTPYLGLGVAAHSFDGQIRRYNSADIRLYTSASKPIYVEESLTESQRINEYLLIRLRTAEGLLTGDFASRFGNDALSRLLSKAARQPTLNISDSCISIPEAAWLISDTILVDLFE